MGKYLKGDVVPCGGEWCEFMVMLTDHEWRHVDTHGHELGHEPIPKRNRTGPYRLTDGTWSDGVDRSVPLYGSDYNLRNPKRLAVTLARDAGQWRAAIKRSRKGKRFDTHAEAIAYADRMARTNQGENNGR